MLAAIQSFFKRHLRRFRENEDLLEELQSHLDQDVEDRLARGEPPVEAERHAHLQLGKPLPTIERVRDAEWFTLFESWLRDLTFAVRSLLTSPVFFVTSAFTLALGMAASTVVFSFLYGLLLRPLAIREPSRLVQLGLASYADSSNLHNAFVGWRMLSSLQRELRSYDGIAGLTFEEVTIGNQDGTVRHADASLLTGNAGSVVGLQPYLGRMLAPFDDRPGGSAHGWPVVLGYAVWNDRFGADRSILGRQLKISGKLATVVGVLPPAFKGFWAGAKTEVFLPLRFYDELWPEYPLDGADLSIPIFALGRLKHGVSLASANAELSRLQTDLQRNYIPIKRQHDPFFAHLQTRVAFIGSGIPNYITRLYAKPLLLMQGLVALVLLLCCSNVAGLMLTKMGGRRQEFAVRIALGAPAFRLVRQALLEAFLVAATGGLVGALLTWFASSYFLHFFRDPMMGESMQIDPDRTAFVVSAALAIFATFFFGWLPAWRAGHADPGSLLKTRGTLGGKGNGAGRILLPIQAALCFTLVTLAALLGQSIVRLRTEHTGFDTDHVTIQTSPFYLVKTHGEEKLNLYKHMLERLDQMPGIRAASVTSRTPLTGEPVNSAFQALGQGARGPGLQTLAFNDVGPDYFRTMAVPILSGREFGSNERHLNVCVVNQTAANVLFPNGRALDGSIRAEDPKQFPANTVCHVVGIAADAKFSDVRQGPPPTIYFPVSLERFDVHIGGLVFLINSDRKLSAIDGFRRALRELAPNVPLVIFVTLREQMDAALGSEELLTLLSSFFGAVSLLLSALGLYGLLASSVLQRTAEIGVRLALGGTPGSILSMVLKEAIIILCWGLGGGAVVLVLVSQFVRAMLHGVRAWDVPTLGTVVCILGCVALLAAMIPAWRASRVNPTVALRHD
ncbi:MAG: ABC transporter permease [Rhodospirillales bacterium]|nr:ABC transporter permease [Acetobacter sp.]